jgi:hypothetical protein
VFFLSPDFLIQTHLVDQWQSFLVSVLGTFSCCALMFDLLEVCHFESNILQIISIFIVSSVNAWIVIKVVHTFKVFC